MASLFLSLSFQANNKGLKIMGFLKDFPHKEQLLDWYSNQSQLGVLNVNAHIHTPYSFSAFKKYWADF